MLHQAREDKVVQEVQVAVVHRVEGMRSVEQGPWEEVVGQVEQMRYDGVLVEQEVQVLQVTDFLDYLKFAVVEVEVVVAVVVTSFVLE